MYLPQVNCESYANFVNIWLKLTCALCAFDLSCKRFSDGFNVSSLQRMLPTILQEKVKINCIK